MHAPYRTKKEIQGECTRLRIGRKRVKLFLRQRLP
jgi:hypothetical protein